jgi:hypothetical protein
VGPQRRCVGADAVQENAGRLVGQVLRHQLAAERLGEDGPVEMADELAESLPSRASGEGRCD